MNIDVHNTSRINVVGSSGSGKSTLARKLADRLGHPYIELDAVFWRENWTQPPDDEFLPDLEAALKGDAWVLDGNYQRTTPIKWRKVEMVVWLLDPQWLTAI